MKGTVLGADQTSGSGHIRGEDGKRYAFTAADIRSPRKCKGGETVDFEPVGEAAKDVYVVGGGSIQVGTLKDAAADASKMFGDMVANPPSAGEFADQLQANPIARFLLGRAAVFYALLILAACFLAYTPKVLSGPYGIERYSLMGISSPLGKVKDAVEQLDTYLTAISKAQSASAAPNSSSPTFDGFSFLFYMALNIQYLLYLIPLTAAYVLVKELGGGASRGLRVLSGLLALALPTTLMLLSVFLIWAALPEAIKNFLTTYSPNSNVTQMFDNTSLTTGFVALVITGLAAMLAAFGILKAPLDYVRSHSTAVRS